MDEHCLLLVAPVLMEKRNDSTPTGSLMQTNARLHRMVAFACLALLLVLSLAAQ